MGRLWVTWLQESLASPRPSRQLVTLLARTSSSTLKVPSSPRRCSSSSAGELVEGDDRIQNFSPIGELMKICRSPCSPGSGCSTLLKVLSNNVEAYKSVEGTRSYDGATPDEMAKHHTGDIAYLPEVSWTLSRRPERSLIFNTPYRTTTISLT